MTDSGSHMSGSAAADAGTSWEPRPSLPRLEARGEEPPAHTEEFDAGVEEIRRRYGSNLGLALNRLEDRIRRRLGVAPLSTEAAVLFGSLGVVFRLALALLVTALAGQWTGIPWGRWAVILVFYGLFDASRVWLSPPLDVQPPPRLSRYMEDWTALLPTIVRDSDLRDQVGFTRRWVRLPVAAVVGVVVATLILGACRLFAPTALSELHAGSIVLLALLLFDFGASVVNPIEWAIMTREARYEHHLFLSSPVDSPEVQKAVRMTNLFGFVTGMWITINLVLAVVLVPWESPLVLPLAVGFVVFG